VAVEIATGRLLDWQPNIVHANDWHTGLLPLLLSTETGPKPPTVFTIHNLAFQGNFPREVLSDINVPERFFTAEGVEFYGQVSYLKAAIRYGDKITTVSPTYASEILLPEFGCGLDGLLRNRQGDFSGILNGIDADLWNPETDYYLPQAFGARDISGKRVCKAELQRECGLEVSSEIPLIGFVSRLAHQKMADVIRDAIPSIVEFGAQFVLVGEGDPALEAAFEELGRQYPSKVAIHIGYEEALAHRLQAGADILLAPARFEPCGLTQLYASRYGTLPLVRRTGGLADTVTDATAATLSDRTATGFVFEDESLPGLLRVIDRALALYEEPLTWRRLQLQAMARDFSWNISATKYAALYHEAAGIPYSLLPSLAESSLLQPVIAASFIQAAS
jgi:starch synthase